MPQLIHGHFAQSRAELLDIDCSGGPFQSLSGPDTIQVNLTGEASDPLFHPQLLVPDIEWTLQVTIDNSRPNTTYTVTGTAKGFPEYEAYIFDGNSTITLLQNTPGPANCSTFFLQMPNLPPVTC